MRNARLVATFQRQTGGAITAEALSLKNRCEDRPLTHFLRRPRRDVMRVPPCGVGPLSCGTSFGKGFDTGVGPHRSGGQSRNRRGEVRSLGELADALPGDTEQYCGLGGTHKVSRLRSLLLSHPIVKREHTQARGFSQAVRGPPGVLRRSLAGA
jgi:hypothetical protein